MFGDLVACAICGTRTFAADGDGPTVCGECFCDVREVSRITYPALLTEAGQTQMQEALYAALAGKQAAA